jgi:hypothetical protein
METDLAFSNTVHVGVADDTISSEACETKGNCSVEDIDIEIEDKEEGDVEEEEDDSDVEILGSDKLVGVGALIRNNRAGQTQKTVGQMHHCNLV